MDDAALWGKTPHQFNLVMEGHQERLAREHNERVSLAWHIEKLHRVKTIPRLETLVTRPRVRRAPMSPDRQWQAMVGAAMNRPAKKV